MTRETKIGLIVAGSCLCLVCIVVASKWRRGDDPSEEQTIQVAAVKPTQNARGPETKKKDGEPAPQKTAPPLLNVGGGIGDARPLEAPPLELIPMPSAPSAGGIQLPPEFQIVNPKDAEPKFLPLPPLGGNGEGLIPPSKPLQGVEEKKPGLPAAPPLIGFGTLPMKPEVAPVLPFAEKDQPPAFQALPPKDGLPSFPPLPAPKDGLPSPSPMAVGEGFPSFPPLPAAKDIPLVTPKDAVVPPLGLPTPLPKDGLPMPAIIDTTPNPIPKIPAKDLPSIPLGGIGGAAPLPIVTDTNTEPYVCVAGDTTFSVLSQRFYGSEKYADALLAYNREQSKWIRNGSAFLTNPPTLAAGQQVERPPVKNLELSYRAWIREANGSAMPTIPPTMPRVTITPPVPLGSGPGVIPVATVPGAGRTYRVQNPNGESVFDVAERTLGNRSLWPEIWRVNQTNPAVRPPAAIPFGTELKLP